MGGGKTVTNFKAKSTSVVNLLPEVVLTLLKESVPAKHYYRAGELSHGDEPLNAFMDGSRAPQEQTLQGG
jgi:hypothetical protein